MRLQHGPVAVEEAGRSVRIEDEQLGCDLVEKVAVVADYDDRTRKVDQRLLHHLCAGQIEMIRRLIEDQNLSAGEEALGQRDPRLLPA